MSKKLSDLFGNKKVLIGMIHLAGRTQKEKIKRALEEADIYAQEGIDGAVIEDYHGTPEDVEETLKSLSERPLKIQIGVNVLRDPYRAFELADKYKGQFVQFDTIQASRRFNENLYNQLRKEYSCLFVFGGVRFKYIPLTGKTLEEDIKDGVSKCDAIVTTGEGTGIETPLQKLIDFRKIMGNSFPLIVGAGVNDKNIREQLAIANGAVIGSYFKNYDTESEVEMARVREIVKLARAE